MREVEVPNMLLPEELQNQEWLQCSPVTLVNFDILFEYNLQKTTMTDLSIVAFCTQLASRWGESIRGEKSNPQRTFSIPMKSPIRSTSCAHYELRSPRLQDIKERRTREFVSGMPREWGWSASPFPTTDSSYCTSRCPKGNK